MRCRACAFENPAAMRFCGQCGAVLVVRSIAPYTPKHLAEKILSGRSDIKGERRRVTVLFADLAGFTTLAERLDPEEVHQIINRCFDLITAEIHRFEGAINQYTGDGVMALFGAPIAHEDSARRAAHASLGIQHALSDYGQELQARRSISLQMRIGLNTGPVVVGRIGDDLRMDYTAVGDTTNLAARLQQAARPGCVVVSESTLKAISGFFETLDLGDLEVKGHAPVRAYQLLRARGRRARLDIAVERGLTPYIGRQRELTVLLDLFRNATSGRGQVALITGEAGIGKSRLLLELRRQIRLAGDAVSWLEGRGISFGQAIPFLPIIDQLRGNFGIEEPDGEPEIIAKVEHGMRRLGNLEVHIPFVRYLLSVDPGDPAISVMDAAARRKRVLDACRALVLRETEFRPIVLVFEDLQWADTSTEEYVGSLLDLVGTAPVMLAATYRTGYTPPFGSRTFSTTLALRALPEAEAIAMGGALLGTDRFPWELQAALGKAEGVPLFIEEVTKALIDLAVIHREIGGYRVVKDVAEVRVPDTIHEIIMARLDRLGEEGRRAVQVASVIGRQFSRRLLERIAGLGDRLDGLLAELTALEIVYEQPLPEPAYVFKHALIEDVAYNSLLVQRRKELHRAAGTAIEELFADRLPEHCVELAHHFAHGEEWAKSAVYSRQAGDRAAHAFANAEANSHYSRALIAAQKSAAPLDDGSFADLHQRRAAVLLILNEYDDATAEFQQTLELVRRIGDQRREVETLQGLSLLYNRMHRGEPAVECNEQALAIARNVGDRALQAACLANRVRTRTAGWGQVVETYEDAEEALRLARELGDRRLIGQTLLVFGTTLQWRGDYRRALDHLLEGAAVVEETHQGFFIGYAAFFTGVTQMALGNYEEALRWFRRMRDYARDAGDRFWIARAPNLIGGVYLDLFDLEESLRFNLEGDEVAQTVSPWPEPRAHSLLKIGLTYLQRGDHGLADEFFRRTWGLFEGDTWFRWRWHIPLLRARGALALAERRYPDAWDFASQSLGMARQSDSRKHVAAALRLQGEVLVARGRFEEAAQTLEASVGVAEACRAARETWLGRKALGRVLAQLGRDNDAEKQMNLAARAIETIASKLTTPRLRLSFVTADPVMEVYRMLGRRPPPLAS